MEYNKITKEELESQLKSWYKPIFEDLGGGMFRIMTEGRSIYTNQAGVQAFEKALKEEALKK